MWRNVLATHSVTHLLQHIEIALISRWTYAANGPSHPNRNVQYVKPKAAYSERAPRDQGDLRDRFRFGVFASFSQRCSGTPFEAKGVPPFSRKNPTRVPPRNQFLRGTAVRIVICYLVMDILTSSGRLEDNPKVYSLDLIPLFWPTRRCHC